MQTWTIQDRHSELDRCIRSGAEVVIIGGGVTGAGVLRECANRGLRALLVEAGDFARGTSSASSKLVHGGLRYLAELDVQLTRQASVERQRLVASNPNLIRPLPFLILNGQPGVPSWKLRTGLSVYRALSGDTKTRMLRHCEWPRFLSLADLDRLYDVGITSEAHVHDSRLVMEILKDARRLGGRAVSHCAAVGFLRHQGRVSGLRIYDRLRNRSLEIRAMLVVNATGIDVDAVRRLQGSRPSMIRRVKGTHLVLPRSLFPLTTAVGFPNSDGRHLFAYPIDDAVLVGTTETDVTSDDRLRPTREECEYLLRGLRRYFPRTSPGAKEIRTAWSGARPLFMGHSHRKENSRDHGIIEDRCGLFSIAGGKLTTFRRMGEALVNRLLKHVVPARRAHLTASTTVRRPLRPDSFDRAELMAVLWSEFELEPHESERLVRTWGVSAYDLLTRYGPKGRARLGTTVYRVAELQWVAEHEIVSTLCDVLERRTTIAQLSFEGGMRWAGDAAAAVGEVLGWSVAEQDEQQRAYCARIAAERTPELSRDPPSVSIDRAKSPSEP